MDNVNLTEMNLNDFQKMIAPIEIVLTSQDITSNCESSNYKNISESVKKEIHVKSLKPINLSNNKNSIHKEPIKKKEDPIMKYLRCNLYLNIQKIIEKAILKTTMIN